MMIIIINDDDDYDHDDDEFKTLIQMMEFIRCT